MDEVTLRRLLAGVRSGKTGLDDAIAKLKHAPFERLGDVVTFHWEAVTGDGEVSAVGLNVLVLAADGRIERDYTFVVA